MKFSFNVDLYSHRLKFATTAEELKVEATSEFQFFYADGVAAILCVDVWNDYKDIRFLRALSHECNHAAMYILDEVGVRFDAKNQEALCYLQDYIFSRILTKLFSEDLK